MEITSQEISSIFNKILVKIKLELPGDYIQLKTDYYKLIPTEKWDDFSNLESDTHSLVDDITELKKLIYDEERPTTFIDLERLSSLLREISQLKNPI